VGRAEGPRRPSRRSPWPRAASAGPRRRPSRISRLSRVIARALLGAPKAPFGTVDVVAAVLFHTWMPRSSTRRSGSRGGSLSCLLASAERWTVWHRESRGRPCVPERPLESGTPRYRAARAWPREGGAAPPSNSCPSRDVPTHEWGPNGPPLPSCRFPRSAPDRPRRHWLRMCLMTRGPDGVQAKPGNAVRVFAYFRKYSVATRPSAAGDVGHVRAPLWYHETGRPSHMQLGN